MADGIGTGYPPGGYPGTGMGGSYCPGYGTTFLDRLQNSVGKNVTVYVGEESTPITGMLQSVGSNYAEVCRTTNGTNEAMLIPMHAIMAASVPV